MSYQIKAIAPTIYQLHSLRAFNIGSKAIGNGAYIGKIFFNTEEEAKDYLTSRADKYNDEDPEGSESKLADMYADISNGALTLDAVTAYINIIDEEEEN